MENERFKLLTKESTVELARRIAEESDRVALSVLLETRTLFRVKGDEGILLPQYVLELNQRFGYSKDYRYSASELADCPHDLTIAKYSNLPSESGDDSKLSEYPFTGMRVDCRYSYRAFLDTMEQKKTDGRVKSGIEEEYEAGRTLQRMVDRDFRRSELDCQRKSFFSVRYIWKLMGKSLSLWYPSHMSSKQFKAWLSEDVNDVDPNAPNEQRRIQSLMDKDLKKGSHVPLNESRIATNLWSEEEESLTEIRESRSFVLKLANAVTQEKLGHFEKLRSSISNLGEGTVSKLIQQIFSELSKGEYAANRMAAQYGISKATFSRFAGTKWSEKIGGDEVVTVPDLWENTARVLAGNPVFMESLAFFGLKDKLEVVRALSKDQLEQANEG